MKNYVSKLNDRNLQRKRESGITSYVLYSIIILICYKIFELYPLIHFKNSFWEIMPILVCTFNFALALIMIMIVYNDTTNYASNLRIITNSNNSHLLEECLNYSLLIIPLCANISAFIWNCSNNFKNVYFIIMSIIQIMFLIIIILVNTHHNRTKKTTLQTYNGTGEKINDRTILSIIIYIISLFFIIYSFLFMFNYSSNIGKSNIFLFGMLLYSFPCLLLKVLDLKNTDNFTKSLENLEYEINVLQLNDDEIRIRLQENYYGFFISNWINYNSQLLEDLKLDFQRKQANLIMLQNNLSKIDKEKYPKDYNNELKKIDYLKNGLNKDINSFCSKRLEEIKSILNNDKINNKEKEDVITFNRILLQSIKK